MTTEKEIKPAAPAEVPDGGRCAVADGSERLEALRLKLCKVGLHPKYHDTPEKAVDAVCEMIAYFRRELANPPADVCGLVMRKYGVEGFMEEGEQPRCRLVSFPNNVIRPHCTP